MKWLITFSLNCLLFLSLQGTVGYYLFGWRPQLVNLQWISLSWNRSIGLKFLSTRLRRNSRSSLCTNQGLAYRPVLQEITILNIKSGKVTFEKLNWKSSSALFYFLITTVFGLILYLLIDTLFLPLWKLWPSFLKCNFWHVPILYPLDTFFELTLKMFHIYFPPIIPVVLLVVIVILVLLKHGPKLCKVRHTAEEREEQEWEDDQAYDQRVSYAWTLNCLPWSSLHKTLEGPG